MRIRSVNNEICGRGYRTTKAIVSGNEIYRKKKPVSILTFKVSHSFILSICSTTHSFDSILCARITCSVTAALHYTIMIYTMYGNLLALPFRLPSFLYTIEITKVLINPYHGAASRLFTITASLAGQPHLHRV